MERKSPVSTEAQGAEARGQDAAIRARMEEWRAAVNGGDRDALGRLYAADAVLLPPGHGTVSGRDCVLAFWASYIDAYSPAFSVEIREIAVDGNMACEISDYVVRFRARDGAARAVEGKYLVVWRREDDGMWRIHRDIWNRNAPF